MHSFGTQKEPDELVNGSIFTEQDVPHVVTVVLRHNTWLLSSSYKLHAVAALGTLSLQALGRHSTTPSAFV
jgi:hypothetical protein